MGTFSLDLPVDELKYWYNNMLGHHVVERSGGIVTWEGMIYEMTLNHMGISRLKTYDELYNYVTATYIDNADPPETQTSGPAYTQQSIDRYGRKEELLSMDNHDQETAEARRDVFLKEFGWPRNYPVQGGSEVNESASLDVTVVGYVYTMNFRYTTTANGATDNVSDWIKDMVTDDCAEFINLGRVDSNTTSVTRDVEITERVWDLIAEFAPKTASQKIYRPFVSNNRYFEYHDLDLTVPQYLIRNGALLDANSRFVVNAWQIKPALVRDLDYTITRSDYAGIFNDARDFIPDEIQVGVDSGFSWSSLEFSETEQIASLQDYEARIRQAQEVASSTARSSNLNWKRRIGLVEGTPEWDEAVKMGRRAWMKKYRQEKGG